MTEAELRDSKVIWPHSEHELMGYIRSLIDRTHDYGTCVYAMSMAATAAFNYAGYVLGTTGFQAGCADMDILRRTRGMDMGFRIINYENLLYPQYINDGYFPSLSKLIADNREMLAKEAKKRLDRPGAVADRVQAHWEWLVSEFSQNATEDILGKEIK